MATKGVVPTADYAFNAAAKTITFSSGYTGLALTDIMYVTNVKSAVAAVIYDPSDATKGGTLAGLVLTLAFDTTSMNNADDLQIIIGKNFYQDNTQLYSGSLSATGAITGIDTTGYKSVIAQISGSWAGSLWFEGSNDNNNWQELMVMSLDELSIQDSITINGLYQLKTTCKYVRINVLQYNSGTINTLLLGRTTTGINGADLLSLAMDKSNNTPLYIEDITGSPKKDSNNALVPSDAPKNIIASSQSTNAIIFNVDTTGYQSLVIQAITLGSAITIQGSNDGVNWIAILGYQTGLATPTSSVASAQIFVFPTTTKYIRGLATGGSFNLLSILLRQYPASALIASAGLPVNVQSIAGAAAVASSLTGTITVGGGNSNATSIISNTNPLLIAGSDNTSNTTGLLRRLLTDTSGRLITAGTDSVGIGRSLGILSPGASSQNVASLSVQDISQFEGQSIIELLSQILLELRISNQYMYMFPETLQRLLHDTSKPVGTYGNEPGEFRQEQSLFLI